MDMNNVNIEEIVKQVLAGMAGTAPAASASAAPVAPAAAPAGAIPKTAHVAVTEIFLLKLKDVVFVEQTLTNSRETHST